MTDPKAIGFSKRKIIVSTSGVVPIMKQASEELKIELAISLHAVTDTLRDYLVPINKSFPLKLLLQTCSEIAKNTPTKMYYY